MSSDVLSQAQTPTLQEVGQVSVINPGCDCGHCEGVAGRVLALAAPRILALAYREAARITRERCYCARATNLTPDFRCYSSFCTSARRIEALATALEEGTPA